MNRVFTFLILFCLINHQGITQDLDSINQVTTDLLHKGQIEQAFSNAQKAVELAKTMNGEKSIHFVIAMNNMGLVYYLQGKITMSEPYFEKAYKTLHPISASQITDFINIATNLADVYFRQGKYKEVTAPLKDIITIKKSKLQTGDKLYATSCLELGIAQFMLNNFDSSQWHLTESIRYYANNTSNNEDSANYALTLKMLAKLYFGKKKMSEAESTIAKALAIHEKLEGKDAQICLNDLEELIIYAEYQDNNKNVIPYFEKALPLSAKYYGISSLKHATMLSRLGDAYRLTNNFTNSKAKYTQAIKIRQQNADSTSEDMLTDINALGMCLTYLGEFKAAEELYLQSIRIKKNQLHKDSTSFVDELYNLSQIYLKTKMYDEVLIKYVEVANLKQIMYGGNSPEFFKAFWDVADFQYQLRYYKEAAINMKELLGFRTQLYGNQNKEYADALNYIGMACLKSDDNKAAVKYFQESMNLYRKVSGEQSLDYANSLNNSGYSLLEAGDIAKAEPLLLKALEIRIKLKGEISEEYAESLNNIGNLYYSKKEYKKAEESYKKALSVRRQLPDKNEERMSDVITNLVNIYMDLGNYKAAEELMDSKEWVNLLDQGGYSKESAQKLRSIANYLFDAGKYTAAEIYIDNTLTEMKDLETDSSIAYAKDLYFRGRIRMKMYKYEEAADDIKKATILFIKKLGEYNSLAIEGVEAMSMLLSIANNYDQAKALGLLANKRLLNNLRNNFIIQSEQEKLNWYREVEHNFSLVPSYLYLERKTASNLIIAALNQQMAVKSFVLNDGTQTLRLVRKNADPAIKALLEQWQQVKSKIASQSYNLATNNRDNTDSLVNKANALEKEIGSRSEKFRNQWQNLNTGFKEITSAMKEQDAAVEFIRFRLYNKVWTDTFMYAAFVFTNKDTVPHFVPLCEESKLLSLLQYNNSNSYVNSLYRGGKLGTATPKEFKGDSLYHYVWEPLEPYLGNVHTVSIAPVGILHKISFAAMPSKKSQYLVATYKIQQYTCTRQIAEIYDSLSKTDNNVALMGGISYTVDSSSFVSRDRNIKLANRSTKRSYSKSAWEFLPGTLSEIDNIQHLFEKNGKKVVSDTGSAASEERFKSFSGHSPRIIHLATHGFFLPDPQNNKNADYDTSSGLSKDPMLRTGLILAGANRTWLGKPPFANREDGILSAYEISQLDLSNTDLVVLSACETALGDIEGSEGVFGLQRAFKIAGVRNLVVSLWQVPDKETSELMTQFYSYYLSGIPAREAFIQAQQSMRQRYTPYYWAAFVFIQ